MVVKLTSLFDPGLGIMRGSVVIHPGSCHCIDVPDLMSNLLNAFWQLVGRHTLPP